MSSPIYNDKGFLFSLVRGARTFGRARNARSGRFAAAFVRSSVDSIRFDSIGRLIRRLLRFQTRRGRTAPPAPPAPFDYPNRESWLPVSATFSRAVQLATLATSGLSIVNLSRPLEFPSRRAIFVMALV